MYLYFLWGLSFRLVDHILLLIYYLPVSRLGCRIRLALTIRTLSKEFLDIGPSLRIFLVKWIASIRILWEFDIVMMLCLAIEDFLQDFIDFDFTDALLINVVSGTWQPEYIAEPLPPNPLLQNPTSAHISWTFQDHAQNNPPKIVWEGSWIFFPWVCECGGLCY